MMSGFIPTEEDESLPTDASRLGTSREQIAAAAAEANAKYEISRRQVVEFEKTAQVPKSF
jgi:hypothetical protein